MTDHQSPDLIERLRKDAWLSRETKDVHESKRAKLVDEAATALEAAQARIAELEAERSPDFERLRQRGFAPGSYWCFCSQCGKRHNADKRAFRCLECAEASADQDARAEALEEAAAKADDWTLTAEEVANGTGWPANVGEHIGDAIRALKGGSNG